MVQYHKKGKNKKNAKLRNKTKKQKTKKVIPFPEVDWDHIVLCDKQVVEIIQTTAGPRGKAQQ